MAKKTEWGVELGVTAVPEPELAVAVNLGAYAWKIDRHGLLVFGESRESCRENFRQSYLAETGTRIPAQAALFG